MQPAVPVVHLLVAFHALTNHLALSEDLKAEIERQGAALTPALWRATVHLLHEADRGAPGTRVDIGFADLVHSWLGVDDERGFVETYGVNMGDALERDRGVLGPLAEAIANADGPEHVRDLVSHAWSSRAVHLMDGFPQSAGAVVEALDGAIKGCPWSPMRRRSLFESMAVASEQLGDWGRAQAARDFAHRLDEEDALAYIAAQTLLILWCITHDELLLSSERGLDPGLEPSPEGWARVREAVEAGRHADVPAPTQTFVAWSRGQGLEEYVLRIALQMHASLLADMARAVEILLEGREELVVLSFDAMRLVVSALMRRRDRIVSGFEPLPGERRNLYGEAHQGARRPDTMERVAVLRGLHEVLERCEKADPMAPARVHADRAAECTARGEHEEAWPLLVKASELADEIPHDPDRQGDTKARVAEYHWRAGEPAKAGRMLKDLRGPRSAELFRQIAAREPERTGVARAERAVRRRGDLESRCDLARAHLAAGHVIPAERMAFELCRTDPDEPLAWTTLARVLEAAGRYRDAVPPAREALARGADVGSGRVLLARILHRLGPDGRAESTALAVGVIEAHPEAPVGSHDLAEAVRIAHDGGADLRICWRGDAQVWALRETDEPPAEWLGAAVARSGHGEWSPDAADWFQRLAAADEPAETARFVVERVEALQYFRLLLARSLFGVDGLGAEAAAYRRAADLFRGRYGHSLEEAASAATAAGPLPFGFEPVALRLRADPIVAVATADISERGRFLLLHSLEVERVYWIRRAGVNDRLHALVAGLGGGVSAATATRLEPILAISPSQDEEQIHESVWVTRWHHAERPGQG